MFAYVTLGTNNLERAGQFYDALLREMGAGRVIEMPNAIFWATGAGSPMLSAITPADGNPATIGNGVMVALAAENPASVDKLYQKALDLGATDEGEPGRRRWIRRSLSLGLPLPGPGGLDRLVRPRVGA